MATATDPILVPFTDTHARQLMDRDGVEIPITPGIAYTALLGDQVLGCAGVNVVWPGMGIAWVSLSEAAAAHGMWMTRVVKRVMDDVARSCKLHRLEAVVLSGNVVNARWIELLGFEREGKVAINYLPDKRSVIRYERIFG